MGAVALARAVADPQLMGREEVQTIALGPQQRALVVEHEHLVACVQLDRTQRAVLDATRRHEPQAAVDLGGDPLIALAGAGAAHEVHVPLVQVVQIRQAGSRNRAGQVHRRRRVGVRAHEPAGVRPPCLQRRLQRVDHVAAVRRHASHVGLRAPWLGVLASDAPHLDDRHRGPVRQNHSHLQERPDRPAQVRLGVVDEGLRAIPALQQERLAPCDHPEPVLEPVDFCRYRDRRDALQYPTDTRDLLGIRPFGLLCRRPRQRPVHRRSQNPRQRGRRGRRGRGYVDRPRHRIKAMRP